MLQWDEDLLQILLWFFVAVIMGSLVLWAILGSETPPELNLGQNGDLCRKDGVIPRHTIVVIDTTDKLPNFYAREGANFLERLGNKAEIHEKITLLHLKHAAESDPDNKKILQTKLSLCNPGNEEDLKKYDIPPYEARNRFNYQFSKPLKDILKTLPQLPEALNTPLLGALTQIGQRADFGHSIQERDLVIFSDFLQNANGISHYCVRGHCIESVSALQNRGVDVANLSGVNIAMIYVAREIKENSIAQQSQGAKHRGFWTDYFREANAESANWLFSNFASDNRRKIKNRHTDFSIAAPLERFEITSPYGMRIDPAGGGIETRVHKGIDFNAPIGTPIFAANNGTIVKAEAFGDYGNYIRIRHQNGYETAYAHLDKIADNIKAGTRVQRSDIIGYSGETGRVSGPHLHFETRFEDRPFNPCELKLFKC